MAEVLVPSGSWTFDGDLLRVVLGPDRQTRALREARSEMTIPVLAVGGVTLSPGRRRQLQLRLREGADPFLQVGGAQLSPLFDPYRLSVPPDAAGAAEYLVDEVRNALTIEQVPSGPTDQYLVEAPAVPLTARTDDGVAWFDGLQVHLEWTVWASPAKKAAGPQQIALDDIVGLDWAPMVGTRPGFLRFTVRGAPPRPAAEDPACLTWGIARRNRWGTFASVKTKAKAVGGTTSLLAAAVAFRLPHPYASSSAVLPPAPPGHEDSLTDGRGHDALLRRLRELTMMLDEGILTREEYDAAKQTILRHF